jgi:hypothetical protein
MRAQKTSTVSNVESTTMLHDRPSGEHHHHSHHDEYSFDQKPRSPFNMGTSGRARKENNLAGHENLSHDHLHFHKKL